MLVRVQPSAQRNKLLYNLNAIRNVKLQSNLYVSPIEKWGSILRESSSVGRTSPCQGEGRGFEPRLPL